MPDLNAFDSQIAERLKEVSRLVLKVGTNLLRGPDEGLNLEFMDTLAQQVEEQKSKGVDVILVSSGAVGAGAYVQGLEAPPEDTGQRQALAAIGQSRLMHHYEIVFSRYGINVAQILLTRDSLDDRQRYLNVRHTVDALLEWGVLPIVNENDTVAIEELKFGDNDQLAALIAGKIDADLLVLLTDVEGIYDRDPSLPGAKLIPVLSWRDHSRIDIGQGSARSFGLGGMRSKLEAVRLAGRVGILSFIGPGRAPRVLGRAVCGERFGTWCEPQLKRISARKRWLALGKLPGEGRIEIDAGAEKALISGGKSLLPSGVLSVTGDFHIGDLIHVVGPDEEVALGLSQYSSSELELVKGKKTGEISSILPDRQNYEVIHRDDMVVTGKGTEDGWS